MKICKVDGCLDPVDAKGYCRHHYYSNKVYGNPLKAPRRGKHPDICTLDGCNNPYYLKGFCSLHYQKNLKHGNPLYEKPKPKKSYPEYSVWLGFKRRCFEKGHKKYPRYGGRGITVCKRWLHSFENFYHDMGPRPFPKSQIDRIDNDGDYEPGNCRWTTGTINARNRSTTKLTMEKARSIRHEYSQSAATQRSLAKKYGVDQKMILEIVHNRMWKEL